MELKSITAQDRPQCPAQPGVCDFREEVTAAQKWHQWLRVAGGGGGDGLQREQAAFWSEGHVLDWGGGSFVKKNQILIFKWECVIPSESG